MQEHNSAFKKLFVEVVPWILGIATFGLGTISAISTLGILKIAAITEPAQTQPFQFFIVGLAAATAIAFKFKAAYHQDSRKGYSLVSIIFFIGALIYLV